MLLNVKTQKEIIAAVKNAEKVTVMQFEDGRRVGTYGRLNPLEAFHHIMEVMFHAPERQFVIMDAQGDSICTRFEIKNKCRVSYDFAKQYRIKLDGMLEEKTMTEGREIETKN